ncbi:MAG: Glu-tRNA(Gln) amidotransferase subunit GatE [Candidatus Aenigmarchaeota archaeon]|nr:Glu-tRNA(Gln) amidotransferase subunit GatE [Candidatus Aenigmarchaeota archaeon]
MVVDYEAVGFKCGIEIHNRLSTHEKLFCSCIPKLSAEKPNFTITRRLRPVAGEMGRVDVAASYEFLRDRTFHYQCFPNITCEVERDEEPPHPLNMEALTVAIQVCKLLGSRIVDEVHVMRKTIIDGSNTTSFQRTALIATGGIISTSLGPVRIQAISIEEESAGIVEQKEDRVVYRLDRLGIPLIEISTFPEVKSAAHAREVSEKLGMIVRSTGKSQRGIGVTRQDINLSVKGGKRVEVKGVQELDLMETLIEKEVLRQVELMKIGKSEEETRVAQPDGTTVFSRPLPGGERMYPETDVPPISLLPNFLASIQTPETFERKLARFQSILPKDLAEQVLKSDYLDIFESFERSPEHVLIASVLTNTIKDLRRKGIPVESIQDSQLRELLSALELKKIAKEAVPQLLEKLSRNPEMPLSTLPMQQFSEEDLRKLVKKVFQKWPALVGEKKFPALMGEVMKEARGKIDGAVVKTVLEEELNK